MSKSNKKNFSNLETTLNSKPNVETNLSPQEKMKIIMEFDRAQRRNTFDDYYPSLKRRPVSFSSKLQSLIFKSSDTREVTRSTCKPYSDASTHSLTHIHAQ